MHLFGPASNSELFGYPPPEFRFRGVQPNKSLTDKGEKILYFKHCYFGEVGVGGYM